MPPPKLWTVPTPPVPDLLPETVGFWRPGGEFRDVDSRLRWLADNGLSLESAERRNRLMAVSVAARVLPIFESDRPGDDRPRKCLIAVDQWAEGGSRKRMDESAWSAWSAGSARFARFAGFAGSAGSARFAGSAGSARFAGYAGSAGYAGYARSAGYAGYARSAESAERIAQSRLLTLAVPRSSWSDTWATGTAEDLAETIFADRAFDRMPILADAIEDAGCDDADLLRWCRELPPHCWYRGCWLLDALTGRDKHRPKKQRRKANAHT